MCLIEIKIRYTSRYQGSYSDDVFFNLKEASICFLIHYQELLKIISDYENT